MARVKFSAGDDPRLAERRQSHRLGAVELGILEGSQSDQPGDYRGRKSSPIDIELIGEHKTDLFDWGRVDGQRFAATEGSHAPRFGGGLIFDRQSNSQDPTAALRVGNNTR